MVEEMLQRMIGEAGIATEAEILKPNWIEATKFHDWRNYIWPEVRACWDQLSHESRIIAACYADNIGINRE